MALFAVTGAGGGAIPRVGPDILAGGAMPLTGGTGPLSPTGGVLPVMAGWELMIGGCGPEINPGGGHVGQFVGF